MASITKQIELKVGADAIWRLLGDVGAADKAFPGVLTACRLEGQSRIVTFANGMVVRELIVDVDHAQRRLAYAVVEGRFAHHHASMQVFELPEGRSRLIWVSDFLPDEYEPLVRGLVETGTAAFQQVAQAVP